MTTYNHHDIPIIEIPISSDKEGEHERVVQLNDMTIVYKFKHKTQGESDDKPGAEHFG